MKHYPTEVSRPTRGALLLLTLFALCSTLWSQQQSPNAASQTEEEVIELSPFTVDASQDTGYAATSTLAGTRLRTDLKDIGTSISVLTKEFLEDLGATNAETALSYATNSEVASVRGNFLNAGTGTFGANDETSRFLNPSSSTRVRGLVNADNTRNYFRTNVAWDGYNVGRVDLLRGPNSILFGLGSPGGVANASTDAAHLRRDSGRLEMAIDQFGTNRAVVNVNKVVLKDELAFRLALLRERNQFRQDFAHEDQDRQYITGTWRPRFLNRGGTTLEITADYERGDGRSNRPRLAPPIDQITPWFSPTVIQPIQLPAGTNFRNFPGGLIPGATYHVPGYTVTYAQSLTGTNPLVPGIGINFDGAGIKQVFSGPNEFYWITGRQLAVGVLNPNGTVYTGDPFGGAALYGTAWQQRLVLQMGGGSNNFPANVSHPFANAFVPMAITDPTIYDFYNNLLDGPNKREWFDFDQKRIVVSNTFLRNKLGYEVSHYRENSYFAQNSLLSDNARIHIDVNQFLQTGQANPNFGRAYIQESNFNGNRLRESKLEGTRASAFFDHDFRKKGDSWLEKTLGRHVLNAVWSEDVSDTHSRTFERFVYPNDLLVAMGRPNARLSANTRNAYQYYISGDLRSRASLSGAGLSNISAPIIDSPGQGPIALRYFDPTWIAVGVDPNAVWVNPQGQNSRQAANPANYRGWAGAPRNFTLIDALSGNPADLDLATRVAGLLRNEVESTSLSWQGYLLNGAVVGTFGWREDESTSWRRDAGSGTRPDGGANVDPNSFNYTNAIIDRLVVRSKNTSVVAHMSRLPFLSRLPLDLSVSYNKGENFNPTAGRVNMLNQRLDAPQGETEEYGVLLSTKDNRYSMRLTKYETSVRNTTSLAIPSPAQFRQFFDDNGAQAAGEASDGTLRAAYLNQPTQPAWSISDQENIHAPAWYNFERAFRQAFPSFVDSWLVRGTFAPTTWSNTNTQSNTFFQIAGVNTEDNTSKGYELEFTANPTRSLRLTFNASRTEAQRDNAPGAATAAIYEFIEAAMWSGDTPTAAGQLRSGFDPFGDTMAGFWRRVAWPNYQVVRQLNGQRAQELVEWRFNGLVNYAFTEGRLRGASVGGAYRWEGERAIGYRRYFDSLGIATPDVVNPIMAPGQDRIDLTVAYRRKLRGKVEWKVQLNLYNAFGDNELVPTRANPDGTNALFRIQEGRSWRLTNTISF